MFLAGRSGQMSLFSLLLIHEHLSIPANKYIWSIYKYIYDKLKSSFFMIWYISSRLYFYHSHSTRFPNIYHHVYWNNLLSLQLIKFFSLILCILTFFWVLSAFWSGAAVLPPLGVFFGGWTFFLDFAATGFAVTLGAGFAAGFAAGFTEVVVLAAAAFFAVVDVFAAGFVTFDVEDTVAGFFSVFFSAFFSAGLPARKNKINNQNIILSTSYISQIFITQSS